MVPRNQNLSIPTPEIVEATEPLRSAAGWRPLCVGAGPVSARLVNGVFGDPLLEVKFKSRSERLLFDLGDATALSRRVLHTVTDVFLTHAHLDHRMQHAAGECCRVTEIE
jgi:ribonuclease Z